MLSAPSLQNISEDCTICAEPIHNYVPEYFNGVEMNAACESCKSPSVENQKQNEEPNKDLATELTKFSYDAGHRKTEEKIEKARRKVRSKAKAKLEMKLKNGDISRYEVFDLEEKLVKELDEEILADFKGALEREAALD